jgi:sulfofructose kinase
MPNSNKPSIDVLCVGHASYDLIFSVAAHPTADEKITAENFISCGGGPAANAAIAVARLGYQSAFAGYLSYDIYGEKHYQELTDHGINTKLIVRGQAPTPISTIIVKPNGNRALINYKGATQALAADAIDFSDCSPKAILFDGHEPNLSLPLMALARRKNIPTILDAGSVHEGTLTLMQQVDYLACSEKFALQYAGDINLALQKMAQFAPAVIITLGNKGLIWQRGKEQGSLPAYSVDAVDTTGAGDAFHGALAARVAANMDWLDLLKYSSAAGALCCTRTGARPGLPNRQEHQTLWS